MKRFLCCVFAMFRDFKNLFYIDIYVCKLFPTPNELLSQNTMTFGEQRHCHGNTITNSFTILNHLC